ncbi:MAG TPA: branched-chain amino acid ABC transporter permease [Actinomycetota bacterium]
MIRTGPASRAGLIAGGVTVYLCLVGLMGRFTELMLVGEAITFSLVLLALPPLAAAYVVTRPRIEKGEMRRPTRRETLLTATFAGLVAGAVAGAFVLAVDALGIDRVRETFIQVSADLMEFLTFGRSSILLGTILLVVFSVLAGLLGGGLQTLDARVRGSVVTGVVAVLVMGMLQRIVPIAFSELERELQRILPIGIDRVVAWVRDLLYSPVTGGLTWVGASIIFVAATGFSAWSRGRGRAAKERARGFATRSAGGRTVSLAIVAALLIVTPILLGKPISETLGTVQVYLLLGLGLNIIVGYAGLLNLGFVVFFALGAYSLALLTGASLNTFEGPMPPVFSLDLNFYVAMPIVMVLGAVVGILTAAPALHLRGDYLALVTLGLGQVMTTIVASPWATPLVGGPQGMTGITDAALQLGDVRYGFRDPQHFFYLALAFVVLAIFVSYRLANSRIGRGWTAMREDEQIANAMGVSTTRYKLLAFAIGGAVGAVGGALFAVKIGAITPASFEVLVSITTLGVVILGGIGSLPGVVTGALVLIGLPGLLREFEEYRLLVYGAAIVAIMVLRPQGLVPNIRRSRELQEEEKAQDSWQQIFTEGGDAPPGEGGTEPEATT